MYFRNVFGYKNLLNSICEIVCIFCFNYSCEILYFILLSCSGIVMINLSSATSVILPSLTVIMVIIMKKKLEKYGQ